MSFLTVPGKFSGSARARALCLHCNRDQTSVLTRSCGLWDSTSLPFRGVRGHPSLGVLSTHLLRESGQGDLVKLGGDFFFYHFIFFFFTFLYEPSSEKKKYMQEITINLHPPSCLLSMSGSLLSGNLCSPSHGPPRSLFLHFGVHLTHQKPSSPRPRGRPAARTPRRPPRRLFNLAGKARWGRGGG